MKAKFLILPSLLVAGLALAAPSFAAPQGTSEGQPADHMQGSQPDQMQQGNAPADQMQGGQMGDDQAAQPSRPMRHRHISARHAQHMAAKDDGNQQMRARDTHGEYGMDVAPGGGTYSRSDVRIEDRDRMSHPVVGEAKAPSSVAQGSLADVEQKEREITSRLNDQQANGGMQQSAQAPNQ